MAKKTRTSAAANEVELQIEIDRNRLDDEWVNQPRLRFQFGVELADAKADVTRAKAELELVKAELELAVRSDPEAFDLVKVTEAAVTATVLTSEQYAAAKQTVINKQHDADVIDAAVYAIDHRKKALEDLVQLHLSGYFGEPRAPGGAEEAVDEMVRAKTRKSRPKRGG